MAEEVLAWRIVEVTPGGEYKSLFHLGLWSMSKI